MSGTVNIAWVADTVIEAIPASGYDLSKYTATVQRDVDTLIALKGLNQVDMETDIDGHYTSPLLISYAIMCYKKHIYFGFWGGRSGDNEDIYREKYDSIKDDIAKFEASVTAQMLYKIADENGNAVTPKAQMRVLPYGGGASL